MTKSSILTMNSGSWGIKVVLFQTGELLKRGLYGKADRIGLSGLNPTFDAPARNRRDSRTNVRVIRTDEDLMIARSVSHSLKTATTKGFDS
jgi:acetate kinase